MPESIPIAGGDAPRPTLSDYKALAHAERGGNGLVCPECHGNDFFVLYTRERKDFIFRKRECRRCGAGVWTKEIVFTSKPATYQNGASNGNGKTNGHHLQIEQPKRKPPFRRAA